MTKKEPGEFNLIIMLIPLLLIFPLILLLFVSEKTRFTAEITQDSMVSANLAIALIDRKELVSEEYLIADKRKLVIDTDSGLDFYDIYKSALAGTLGLKEEGNRIYANNALVKGEVSIESVVIYNVYEKKDEFGIYQRTVDIYELMIDENRNSYLKKLGPGENPSNYYMSLDDNKKPPTRELFETDLSYDTSIWSRISYKTTPFANINGDIGEEIDVHMSQLTDVALNFDFINNHYN